MKTPGIYVISDLSAGKAYVGSSDDLYRRLRTHELQLKKDTHPNFHLQQAFNSGNRLEVLPIPVKPDVDVLKCEQVILDKYSDNGVLYNIAKDALAPMKGRTHSLETRERLREVNLGKGPPLGRTHSEETKRIMSEKAKIRMNAPEVKEHMRQLRTGYEVSDATREKLRQAALGREVSQEAREKISLFNRGKVESQQTIEKKRYSHPDKMKAVSIDGVSYASLSEASREFGVSPDTISNRAKSETSRFATWQFL